jgi:hypothetical protein
MLKCLNYSLYECREEGCFKARFLVRSTHLEIFVGSKFISAALRPVLLLRNKYDL